MDAIRWIWYAPGTGAFLVVGKIMWRILRAKSKIRNQYFSVKDLEKNSLSKDRDSSVKIAKQKARILVIDDENFAPLNNLKRHNYKIIHSSEIERIDDVEDYNVILLDIQGVGKDLDNVYQGSHVIRQIKKLYPEKYVIAYTGGASQDLTSMAAEYSDKYVSKDIAIDTWCEVLDEATLTVSDPIFAWKNFRHRLLDNGITPIQLTSLEDAYVRNILSKSGNLVSTMEETASKMAINQEMMKIITSVASSVITKEITERL